MRLIDFLLHCNAYSTLIIHFACGYSFEKVFNNSKSALDYIKLNNFSDYVIRTVDAVNVGIFEIYSYYSR